jgi:hypothetical protein
MLRLLAFLVDLFTLLPWWQAVGILLIMAAGAWALVNYLVHRMMRECIDAVAQQGSALSDARVSLHCLEPAEAPNAKSQFDLDADDEDDDFDAVGEVADADYVWIDATIAPTQPDATWDPSDLALVRSDFEPEEALEICEQTGVLHSFEVWSRGEFIAGNEGEVTGPQRLRMLFAVPRGLREAKFSYRFTHFGSLTLPTPLATVR